MLLLIATSDIGFRKKNTQNYRLKSGTLQLFVRCDLIYIIRRITVWAVLKTGLVKNEFNVPVKILKVSQLFFL